MGIQKVGDLSLGQWIAIGRQWNKAHGGKPGAPSDDEFDAAVKAAKSLH